MEYVQYGLLALAVLWALQLVGSYHQVRKYQQTLSSTLSNYKSGYLGIGAQRSILSSGSIVILVLSDEMIIESFQAMTGRTVLSKFSDFPEFVGHSEKQLLNALAAYPSSFKKAVTVALDQASSARNRSVSRGGDSSTLLDSKQVDLKSYFSTAQ